MTGECVIVDANIAFKGLISGRDDLRGRLGPASVFNKGVVLISSRADFEAVLARYLEWRRQFVDERGELLPRFQQAPMVASFMQEPGVAQPQAIPVPKGPVDVW
jgi:hypothetical protein